MPDCEKKSKCHLMEECEYRKEVWNKTGKDLQPKKIIENLGQALKALKEIRQDDQNVTTFYRGHSNANYHLNPSIYRPLSKDDPTLYVKYEDRMFREILSRHPEEFKDCKTTVEKLAIMQHYELPTRLLDVTQNPLIALYFACHTNPNKPGMIFSFKVNSQMIKYVDSDTVSVLANLAKMDRNFDVSETYDLMNSEQGIKLLHEIGEEKPYFAPRIKPEHLNNYIVCVKPKHNNARIIAQQGAFLLFGIQKKKSEGSYFWTKQGATDPKRAIQLDHYCIPSKKKKAILEELDKMNINDSTVFPQIEKTAQYVRNNVYKLFGKHFIE